MNLFKKLLPTKHGIIGAQKYCRATFCSILHSAVDHSVEVQSPDQEVVIALGSNVGDRLNNFNQALQLMRKSGIHITKHGCLYETAPAYVTDQPRFLNSAVRAVTKLGPHELLGVLKTIERNMGRSGGIRYGPRPIDLDILFYGKYQIGSDILTVPHERIWERPFVMAPLMDLLGLVINSDTVACWHSLSTDSDGLFGLWDKLGGESLIGKEGMKRVLPIRNHLWEWSKKTSVMGADIIDIGAQSTRPMASRISAEEELDRLIPVLEAVLEMPEMEEKLVSVDTFYSDVASEAVKKGAHLVNDVSAGQLDPNMLKMVASLDVPYIAMHMRGDPTTMQSRDNLQYSDVCSQVASELFSRVEDAELSGVPAWRIILDPGIGFSKKTEHNLDILTGLPVIRSEIAKRSLAASHAPLLIGPSRKRFLGEICNRPAAGERDPATIASVTAGIFGGANIVRVHNVRDNVDAVKVCDAMLKERSIQL
ncbi:hypothetical protein ERO13_D12G163500v2 [Gossypium hirsutum]|uniref:Folate synthesis bifunctional protein, mitochondrial isoform X2 n=1 Tax=Gossypium hirsutum TaxID=3635 RepID=A0A1U8NE70_GOSHI|nr:folate synthesis bifunctional protein, mitochondrial isoform X2 [Gossypium hirsutum]KAG4116337.1 hypothetical protein ERO13_D12G163500v2 [Gossypium hirsutum]